MFRNYSTQTKDSLHCEALYISGASHIKATFCGTLCRNSLNVFRLYRFAKNKFKEMSIDRYLYKGYM